MPSLKPEGMLLPLALLWVAAAEGIVLAPAIAILTAVVFGFLAFRRLVAGVRLGLPSLVLALFVLWVALDGLLQPVPWDQAAHLFSCGVGALALAVISAHPSGQRWLRLAVGAAGLLSCLWLVVEKLAVGGRPGGPFLNPNLAAELGLLGWALLWGGFSRSLVWAVTPVFLAGVWASGSRAATLAAIGLALGAGLATKERKSVLVVFFLAVAVPLTWVGRWFTDPDPLRFERLRIWHTSVRVAQAYFPWGTGPGGFEDAVLAFNFPRDGEFARFARFPGVAESDALQVAASLGLPGLVLALALAVSLWFWGRGQGLGGWGPLLVVAIMSALHSNLFVPVGAFAAVGAGRFSGWKRVRLSRGLALALVMPLGIFSALGLAWPRGPVGDVFHQRFQAVNRVLMAKVTEKTLASALIDAETLVRLAPRRSRAWEALAYVQLKLGQQLGEARVVEASLASFKRAQELNPKGIWAFRGEAMAWLALSRVGQAKSAILRALQLEPNCVSCWLILSQAQVLGGEVVAARTSLTRAQVLAKKAEALTFVSSYEVELAGLDASLAKRLQQLLGITP